MKLLEASDSGQWISQAVDVLSTTISAAIAGRGFAHIGLSGGSTPKPIYEALGKRKGVDWSKVWVFLVDDRYVRPDDPRSNQFLLRSTLLRNALVPESQLVFPDVSLPLEECVDLYDRHIGDLLVKGPPDVIILGMGDDGHIASLFPPLHDDAFGTKNVLHTTTDQFDVHDRISVTLPVLQRSREAVFLLRGMEKKRVWEEMMGSLDDERRWPAKGVLDAAKTTVMFAA